MERQGMYVHPILLMILVATIAVMVTILIMRNPGGLPGPLQESGAGALQIASGAAPTSNVQLYYSTMHPWIVQDHPGTCPICGMELVKMSPGDQADYLANHPEMA